MNYDESSEEDVQEALGASLKNEYLRTLMGEADYDTPFGEIVVKVGDLASSYAASHLNEKYLEGAPPRWDDTILYARICIDIVIERFREVICKELWKSNDLDYSGREIATSIAPIIVVLLGLPSSMTIVAIPISIMIARRGMNVICEPIMRRGQERQDILEQKKLNVMSLGVLEAELVATKDKEVRSRLKRGILQKKREIEYLEKKIK